MTAAARRGTIASVCSRGLCIVAAIAALPSCAWGLRGGPEVIAGSSGSALVQGSVTGAAGFGFTRRDGTVSEGLVCTGTLAAGGDAGRGGGAVSLASGLAWFSFPETRRLGWTAGFEAGLRARGGEASGARLLVGLRGGPHLRLFSRARTGDRLFTLGFDLVVQGEMPAEGGRDDGFFTAGLALTVGFMNVRYFHL